MPERSFDPDTDDQSDDSVAYAARQLDELTTALDMVIDVDVTKVVDGTCPRLALDLYDMILRALEVLEEISERLEPKIPVYQ